MFYIEKKSNTRLSFIVLLILCDTTGVTFGACGNKETASPGQEKAPADQNQAKTASGDAAYTAFANAVDTKWAYDLAMEINGNDAYSDNRLGDRLSGSDAEHRTADKIVSVMKEIGLTDVVKDGVKAARIQAGDSGLTIEGDNREIVLHAYQTAGTPAGGLNAEVVDVGKGTEADYDGKDVAGKIVLIDIDQRADWWIGTPVIQAREKGAAAVLANNVSGFSEIARDAYNANDICGPADVPAASITQIDAEYLRSKMTDGSVKANLVIGNEYSKDGETYNIYGKIKGRDSSEAIMFGAHYDAYYKSFLDDTIAWTGVLAIAKAMIDSGYTPERDIVFCCHGAEEWGESDSAYDWAIGSWRQITEAQKGWQGKLLSFINFELPAYEFADYTYTLSAPESYNMIKDYTESDMSAKPDGAYKDGIFTDGYQTYTYSDDFSYYASGVPSFINGFLMNVQSEEGGAYDFYVKYYHTNYDTEKLYNEAVFNWQLKYYGGLGIHIDATPALELDFTSQAQRLKSALDEDIAVAAGVDAAAYLDYLNAVGAYSRAAGTLAAKVKDINDRYAAAKTDADKAAIMKEAKTLNALNLAIFKKTQDAFLGLSAEEPIVPHQWYLNNISQINDTVAYLKNGDVASAVDNTAWEINGVMEWYAMYFDKATVEHLMGTYRGKYASLNWAEGKVYEFADVGDATRSITARYDETGGDFTKEIAIYNAAKEKQAEMLKQCVADETGSMNGLAAEMQAAGK